ncbi:iron uptake transporter deferrochelatase/peroxidase subunit [Paenibacillus radicis (ex Xue et al. 2023)]|uniref:Deferrochelatase n=1 Tax=Paenibacillus radicis (ex Xue et al. 2023) TaxID=2972489 RepID=A0ABT1YM55_9BACL|nr:iron uptake transporter deferrochelatase/peroxidase subunit [Paenibacillus radicis (ex Xue et al. 2023)]MCR8634246.1 iron uptake transporter deferrochelatase/peroxidase subunit [Paenibacillus radicis (ex Xue et al. 2023)]
MTTNDPEDASSKKISRRDALKLAGVGGVGLLLGAGGMNSWLQGPAGSSKTSTAAASATASADGIIPFYGKHQAGILTPMQDFICMAAFNLTATTLEDVRKLFQIWTSASARLAEGKFIEEESDNPHLPPADTGESAGLAPMRTTLTFGLGASFFDERFGLAGKRPAPLVDLPRFNSDEIRKEWSGGDIVVQVCANDPQVAFHALRNLARIARGKAVLHWMQEGFQRTGAADPSGSTPRNLMGFKDGSNNPNVSEAATADEIVWAQPSDNPSWMAGGSYMVMRRIRIRIEVWDRSSLDDQEATFGRHRHSGAPLSKAGEFDELELDRKDAKGNLVIPANSHVALSHMDGKVKILRRGYSYSSGMDVKTGQLNAGLLFICFNRDPRKQFIPMQQKLASMDKLNEYITHVGSGLYACLPGASTGGYIGDTLF